MTCKEESIRCCTRCFVSRTILNPFLFLLTHHWIQDGIWKYYFKYNWLKWRIIPSKAYTVKRQSFSYIWYRNIQIYKAFITATCYSPSSSRVTFFCFQQTLLNIFHAWNLVKPTLWSSIKVYLKCLYTRFTRKAALPTDAGCNPRLKF